MLLLLLVGIYKDMKWESRKQPLRSLSCTRLIILSDGRFVLQLYETIY
ncbi:MAG TPA: hypothetical protein VM888_04705 [Chitinophagaceae bacterium]|nr:hypothetical protein [Chitinophagaceae bacterium]